MTSNVQPRIMLTEATPEFTSALLDFHLSRSFGQSSSKGAYTERAILLAAVASFYLSSGFAAFLCRQAPADEGYDFLLVLATPAGPASWHIANDDLLLFSGLPIQDWEWDGHDTPEKYARLLCSAPRVAGGQS